MRLKLVFVICAMAVSSTSLGAQPQESFEPPTAQTYAVLMRAAAAQMDAGNYRAAESTLLRTLTFLEQAPAESLEVAVVLHNLGLCYTQLGRGAEAEAALRKSLAITRKETRKRHS